METSFSLWSYSLFVSWYSERLFGKRKNKGDIKNKKMWKVPLLNNNYNHHHLKRIIIMDQFIRFQQKNMPDSKISILKNKLQDLNDHTNIKWWRRQKETKLKTGTGNHNKKMFNIQKKFQINRYPHLNQMTVQRTPPTLVITIIWEVVVAENISSNHCDYDYMPW